MAASKQAQLGIEHRVEVWKQCLTCKQTFTGAMRIGLAEAWRSRVVGPADIGERLDMESNLAQSLLDQGSTRRRRQCCASCVTWSCACLAPSILAR